MATVIKYTLADLYEDLRSVLEDLAERAEDEQLSRPWHTLEVQLRGRPLHMMSYALDRATRKVFAPKEAKAISRAASDLLDLVDIEASIAELWRRSTWHVDEWAECALECANNIPTHRDLERAVTKAVQQTAEEAGEDPRAKRPKQQAERVLRASIAYTVIGDDALRWE